MIQRNVISNMKDTLSRNVDYAEFIDDVEMKLDEADMVAEEAEFRLLHEEVFSGLRRRING